MQHAIKKEVISTHASNSQTVKICAAPKSQGEKCEIKGGGQEMAVMLG